MNEMKRESSLTAPHVFRFREVPDMLLALARSGAAASSADQADTAAPDQELKG
jgi:hypothetical protein